MLAALSEDKLWIIVLILSMRSPLLHQLLVLKGINFFFLYQLVYFRSLRSEHVFQAILLVVTALSKIYALLLFILFDCVDWVKVHVVGSWIVF